MSQDIVIKTPPVNKLYESWRDVPADMWPWLYFTPRELACRGTGSLLVDVDAIDRLERMRGIVGKPFIITSAYRSPLHNARVGGAPRSFHKLGRAFDIRLQGHVKGYLMEIAREVGFGGVAARRNSFIHVDTGRMRTWEY